MCNEELAVLCKDDENHLPALWEAVYRLVRLWAVKYIPADQSNARFDLDDLTQSAYFALLKAVKDYPEDSPYKFTTYLGHHCRNEFSTVVGIHTKKRNPLDRAASLDAPLGEDEGLTLGDAIADPADAYEATEGAIWREQLRTELDKALDTIAPEHGEAIRRRHFFGQSWGTISEAAGITPAQAKNRVSNGLCRLRTSHTHASLRQFVEPRTRYRHVGLTEFLHTGTSEVEWTVLDRERLAQRVKG